MRRDVLAVGHWKMRKKAAPGDPDVAEMGGAAPRTAERVI